MSLASTHHELDALGGGRYRSTIHMKPIASYRNGSLRRDPMTLSATGSADWPLAVDGICDVRVAPRIAGKSPLLHMGHGSHFVRFALVGANNVSGTVKGNTTTFTNAWNGADLRYTYGGHRLQEDILLRAKHPRSFGFILREHTGFDPISMTVGDIRILDPVLEPPSGDMTLAIPLRWIVTQQGGYWVLTVTLPEGDWTGWTVDPTLSLQPDAAAGLDTWLNGDARNTPQGTASLMRSRDAQYHTAMVLFTLASLSPLATVTSATLTLWLGTNSAHTGSISLRRILAANAGWNEASTYNYKVPTTVGWAGGAGCTVQGTDYTAASMGTFNVTSSDTIGTQYDVPLALSQFEIMRADNYGFLMKASKLYNEEAYCTSDHTTAAYRPKLVVEYTLPGGGGIFASSIFHSAIHGQNLTR